MMHAHLLVLSFSAVLCLAMPQVSAADPQTATLDGFLDWQDPFSITITQLDAWNSQGARFRRHEEADGGFHYSLSRPASLFSGSLVVKSVVIFFQDDAPRKFTLLLPAPDASDSVKTKVVDALTRLLGTGPDKTETVLFEGGLMTPAPKWLRASHSIRVFERLHKETIIEIQRLSQPAYGSSMLAADLDALLDFGRFWKWTVADFEKHYSARQSGKGAQTRPPQFEWLSQAKDRARFSRKMFVDAETKLTLFGGSVKVEEAVVEFANGRAARATISIYNRGDSGQMGIPEFEALYKKIGQSLGQVTKSAPKSNFSTANSALRLRGWSWTTPTGIALMEFNDYSAASAPGRAQFPEFLRLKLAAPDQADFSMGRMVVGMGRMSAQQNVTRAANGDVYIANVPMVDQGAKGYCVAASCQRLFEYLRIPCDQHELAQLVNVDAGSGVNAIVMQKSLAKIDGQFKVVFKPHVNPELYYDNKGRRRVSEREFAGIVKEHVDKGTPLLWALVLGRHKEEPPLPAMGQTSGGHMRLIIGYNSKNNQVIFSDSWGAGHELKRMNALGAYDVTLGLYSMLPRGL